MERTYGVSPPRSYALKHKLIATQDAVAALNTLQSNFAIIDAIRKSGKKMNETAIPEMIDWLNKLGYQVRGAARALPNCAD
jgi:hypothetical protein